MTTLDQSTTSSSRSVHETRARALKATRIALVLHDLGVDTDIAARLDDSGQRAVAALAGVRPPSDVTWAAVLGTLQALGPES